MSLFGGMFGGDFNDPKTIGMLQAAAALMQAGGPSRVPVNFGQALGSAMTSGLQGYQGQQEFLAKKKSQESEQAMAEIQLRQLRQQLQQQQDAQEYMKNLQQSRSYGGPMAALPQDKDKNALSAMINSGNPLLVSQAKAIAEANKLLQPKWSTNPTNLMKDGRAVATLVNDEGMTKEIGTPAEKLHFQDLGGNVQGLNPFSGTPSGSPLVKTATPDALARLAAETGDGAEGFSPAAIENAAARYNVDGTLPPMGMGKAGAQGRKAILNRAAELAIGSDPTRLRVNQLDSKAAASALGQVSKSAAMLGSFEDNANANADIALELSSKMDRSGVPLLNAGLQAWKTGTGSPEATQFAAATETFVSEYAKIMSGGMGNAAATEGASDRAHKLLSTSMTKEQFEGNVNLLKREMRNRMKGFEDTQESLKARISGSPSPKEDAGTKPQTFDMLPPASQYDGKRMQSGDGTIYKSIGGKWVQQ